jgi:hypothetical protein
MVVRLVAASVVPLVTAGCVKALSADGAITLRNSCQLLVPVERPISGGSISDAGEILLWSRQSNVLWSAMVGQERVRPIRLAEGSDVVGAAVVRGQIELVDGGRRQVLTIGPDGAVLNRLDVAVPIRLHTAARIPEGWVVGGEGLDGRVSLAIQAADGFRVLSLPAEGSGQASTGKAEGGPSESNRLHWFDRDMADGDGFHLQRHGRDAVLISWVQRPHRVGILRAGGDGWWLPALGEGQLGVMKANDKGWNLWNALPAVSVRSGVLLQTFADLGSTQRRTVVRRADGTPVRSTEVSEPVGFMAASPSGSVLLAFKRIPEPEVLCYAVGP